MIIRNILGLTDEQHGHVREGYTLSCMQEMLNAYEIEKIATYSKAFTELVDIAVSFAVALLSKKSRSKKVFLLQIKR